MQYITILRTILALLPMIIEVIKAIEIAIPGSGQGKAKLEAVRQILEAGSAVAGEAATQFATLWPALQASIGAVVTLFNSTGVFKKGDVGAP